MDIILDPTVIGLGCYIPRIKAITDRVDRHRCRIRPGLRRAAVRA